MVDEEGPQKDPKSFAYFSSAGPRHNIFINFRDVKGNHLFNIDSRPTTDPDQYRHRISLSFSRLDSSIHISESFAHIMHSDGEQVHGKVAEKSEEVRIVATLTLPGASFVVEKGAQERSPWPRRGNDFVIELALLRQTTAGGDGDSIPRGRLTTEHIGQKTKRLETECGELGLRKNLKSLVDLKRVTIYVEGYRGNWTFDQDDVREVLLPRFDTGRQQSRAFQREPVIKDCVLPSDFTLASVEQRTLQVLSSDSTQRRKRKAGEISGFEVNVEVVDSSKTCEESSEKNKVYGEDSGMIPAEPQSGVARRARKRMVSRRKKGSHCQPSF